MAPFKKLLHTHTHKPNYYCIEITTKTTNIGFRCQRKIVKKQTKFFVQPRNQNIFFLNFFFLKEFLN